MLDSLHRYFCIQYFAVLRASVVFSAKPIRGDMSHKFASAMVENNVSNTFRLLGENVRGENPHAIAITFSRHFLLSAEGFFLSDPRVASSPLESASFVTT